MSYTKLMSDAPGHTDISGPKLVMSEEYVQYSCTSDQADPAPLMKVKVTDQNGDDVTVDMETEVKVVEDVGYRVFFSVNFDEHIKEVDIECKAENEVGQAINKMSTQVQCKLKL